MKEAEVIDKIHRLPEDIREHLFLYVDFLYHAYSNKPKASPAAEEGNPEPDFFDENELTEAGKAWLEKRAEQALAHPEKRMSWREAREQIHKPFYQV